MASKLCAFTRFNLPPGGVCSSGSKFRIKFVEKLDENGVKCVVPSGEKLPIQEMIDAFKDDCDIYRILDRLCVADKSPDVVAQAISQFRPDMFTPGTYGDFTTLPKNIHEVSKFYSDSVAFFNGLPSDVRAKYHNSVDEFFANFDSFLKDYAAPAASSAPSSADISKEVTDNE